MGKRTDDRSVIDVVPNGVAFNLAKSWLGLVKKKDDDEDDGNAERKRERRTYIQQREQRDVLVRGIPSGRAKRGRGNVGVRTPRRERRRIATREHKTRIRCEIYEPLESRADDANDRGEENLRSSAKRETHEEDGGKGTRARKFLGRGRGRRGRQRVEQEQEEEDGEV